MIFQKELPFFRFNFNDWVENRQSILNVIAYDNKDWERLLKRLNDDYRVSTVVNLLDLYIEHFYDEEVSDEVLDEQISNVYSMAVKQTKRKQHAIIVGLDYFWQHWTPTQFCQQSFIIVDPVRSNPDTYNWLGFRTKTGGFVHVELIQSYIDHIKACQGKTSTESFLSKSW